MAFTRVVGPGNHTQANIDSHNIHSTGIITAVSFVGDGSGLTGVASTDYIITGTAATFTGGVDINSDLDVDGHTNLDNVSIAGVTTFSGGLTGTTANFSGNVTVGGVLTYEDVKNVDSVGLGTFREGIFLPDNKKAQFGNAAGSADLEIYSIGTHSFIKENGPGGFYIDSNQLFIRNNNTSSVLFDTTSSGAVQLYHNGTKRFETTSYGVLGTVIKAGTSSGKFLLDDGGKLQIGTSQDLQIYHDGNDSLIDFTNTVHNLRIRGDGEIRLEARYNELSIRAVKNAYVELYYDASNHPDAKLQTSEKGIKVGTGVTIETNGQATYTGIVTATAFKLANGSDVGTGAGGTWSTYTAGIATSKSVGVNTSTLDDNDLVGVGNSFQGLYISNGMMITDNTLNGNHYIGTAFNGLMAGPVSIEGTLTIDGNYVVV